MTVLDAITTPDPDAVSYVSLGEIAFYSSSRVDGRDLDKSTFVGVDNLVADKGGKVDATYTPNTERVTAYEPGDILLGNIRPYLKKVWLATNSGGCSGDVLAVRLSRPARERVLPKYLYYVLSSDDFFTYNTQHSKGGKMPRGSTEALLKFRLPVPPVAVQREIVRVLEHFGDLSDQLIAELSARRRQFDFFLDSFLAEAAATATFATVDDLCDVTRGRVMSKDYVAENKGSYPVYSSQTVDDGVFGKIATYDYDGEYLTWTTDGANAGSVFHRAGKFSITNVCGLLRVRSDQVDIRYLYFALRRAAPKYVSRGMGNPKLMSTAMKTVRVPLPPLGDQLRFVKTLDLFDALVNNPEFGLPAELNARRRQFEYYREAFLAFDGVRE